MGCVAHKGNVGCVAHIGEMGDLIHILYDIRDV